MFSALISLAVLMMTSNVDPQRPYFPNLDVLRFLAAFFVLFGHCTVGGFNYLNLPYPLNNLISIICTGKHWVSLFFVLSGFLLGYLALMDKINGNFNIRKFLVRRALRIWPLYFLFVFIGFYIIPFIAKLLLGKVYTYTSLPYFVLFLGNIAKQKVYELNDFSYIPVGTGVLWSISIEEQFYIVLALCFLFLNIKQIKWVTLTFCVTGLIYILMPKSSGVAFDLHTFYYILDFFGGALLGYWARHHKQNNKISVKAKLLEWIIVMLFVAVVLVAHLFSLKLILIVWFILLIYYLTFCNTRITTKLQKAKWLIYGGKISYGIYVIHPILQYGFYVILKKYMPTWSQLYKDVACIVLTSICTIYIAHLSYRYFESFFLKLKERFY